MQDYDSQHAEDEETEMFLDCFKQVLLDGIKESHPTDQLLCFPRQSNKGVEQTNSWPIAQGKPAIHGFAQADQLVQAESFMVAISQNISTLAKLVKAQCKLA